MGEYRQGRGPHFVQVPFELMDDPRCDAYTIAVYAALRRFAHFGKTTGAEVSDATAAQKAGCGERTFRDRRTRLKEMGWIEWEGESGKVNKYVVHASLDTAAPSAEVLVQTDVENTPAPHAVVEPRHDAPDTTAPDADLPRHHVPTNKRVLPRASNERNGSTDSSLRSESGARRRQQFSTKRKRGDAIAIGDALQELAGHKPSDPVHASRSRLFRVLRETAWLDANPPPWSNRDSEADILGELLEHNNTEDAIAIAIEGARLIVGLEVPFSIKLLVERRMFEWAHQAGRQKVVAPQVRGVFARILGQLAVA